MGKVFGHIDGVPQGTTYASRKTLSEAGVHTPPMQGISGNKEMGANSIVVSGEYVDDEDFDNRIIYTGVGGRDLKTKQQISDQKMESGNIGLAVSCDRGLPVRVIRKISTGFRYDGLYSVVNYWSDQGQNGFLIWRFELHEYRDGWIDNNHKESPEFLLSNQDSDEPAERERVNHLRPKRNNAIADWVKDLHGSKCQICQTRLETRDGYYAEAAHIKPLGHPHDGPDVLSNLLCLCPNCHIQLDRLALYIDDDNSVRATKSGEQIFELRTTASHVVNYSYLEYQKGLCRPDGNQ